MRIALFSALYPTPKHPKIVGGAEVFARQFAEALVAGGDEVMVVCNSLEGKRESEFVNGVRVEFIPVRNLFPPFQDQKNPAARVLWHVIDDWQSAHPDIGSLLDDFRPDVINSNTINGLTADIWRVARKRKIPTVHTLHDYYLTCPRCSRFHGENSCGIACTALTTGRRRRAKRVDAVVSVSQRTLDIHLQDGLFSGAEQHVVRNVPNPAISFSPRPLPEKPLRIGYLGRFSPEKGVGLLVDAVARQKPGTVTLALAGNVPEDEKARLRALAPDADLDFVGFVSPSEFYATVDVIAIPSIWEEPGALALVDALAAGRPVIGTRFGGIPEVIEHGVTGWIVPPGADGFAKAITALVDDPSRVLAAHENLRNRPGRVFDDVVREYRAIYRSLIPAVAEAT
ncbi:glycosyltransferase involved in cell wall biosynthesis [Neorhizobium huautlense]|uniref:Glycosyltransferase involved in cell wall biosynthesis n=1 Tax=Neorhizobium huautlense TaxID=67774 RepID=A0ABT9PP12_9HYPH|nr:glycosyltransferase family 4 protein [Neorhizobium huautlense]MDP9835863.1 glycosyltransferase involved in cell wall biosynthesis [Neorhizobium huautlense]